MQTTKGVVSGRIDGPSRLQTDVAVNPGNSGGPLLDDQNEVIGLVTSGMVDAQGINYVAPIDECCVILGRILKKWKRTKTVIPDRLPSLNCTFTKSNRVLLDQINGCKTGVFCSSVHPLIEYPQSNEAALRNMDRNSDMLNDTSVDAFKDYLHTNPILNNIMTRDSWARLLINHSPSMHIDTILGMLRNNTLMEGDIVCSMTVRGVKYEIDLQMTSKFQFWHDNLGFTTILDRLNCTHDIDGDTIAVEFFRGNKMQAIDMELRPQDNTFRKMHADVEDVEYVVLGGVFCMPLLHNHIPLFKREPLHTLMNRPSSRHLSILIISHILPESPFNECETIGAGDVLIGINNELVFTIDDCVRTWEENMKTSNSITIRMRDGSLATASTQQIKDADVIIKKEYNSNEYIGYHKVGGDEKFSNTLKRSPSYQGVPPLQPSALPSRFSSSSRSSSPSKSPALSSMEKSDSDSSNDSEVVKEVSESDPDSSDSKSCSSIDSTESFSHASSSDEEGSGTLPVKNTQEKVVSSVQSLFNIRRQPTNFGNVSEMRRP
jgi:hypothetical protein